MNAEKIIEMLEDRTVHTRWAAWHIMLRAPIAELVVVLLNHSSPFIRWLMCYMLGERADTAAIPGLKSALDDPNIRVRACAGEALSKIEAYQSNPFTSDEIIRLLEASPEESEAGWGRNFYQIERRAAINEIVTALQTTKNASVRVKLCYMLGQREDESAVPTLVEVLQDEDPDVRFTAASALRRIGSPLAGPAVMMYFARPEEDIRVRQELVGALGSSGHREAIPLLVEALKDTDSILRGDAAKSLGQLAAREATEPLSRALAIETESYPKERMEAALEIIRET